MWHRYAGIHHPLFVRLPVSTFVNALQKRPKNSNQRNSLEKLTSRQEKRFQMLDLNADDMIDKTEFNGRIVAMFEEMDSNGDGNLDDKEIRKMKRHNYGKM